MRSSINIFKNKAGIFSPDKYMPLIEAVLNLSASFILVKYFGLAGIFMGTTISTLSIPVLIQSKIVYNQIFNQSVLVYFKSYLIFIILTLLVGGGVTMACNLLVPWTGFLALVAKGSVCVIIVNLIYVVIFFRTKEFQYLWTVISQMLDSSKLKLIGVK